MNLQRTLYLIPLVSAALLSRQPCSAQACPNLDYDLAVTLVGSEPWCSTSGDVNGDSALDILVGRSPLFSDGSVELLLNLGLGAFASPRALPAVISPRALVLADLDGDGDLDLIAADRGTLGTNGYSNDGLWVELNDGAGNFTPFEFKALLAGEDEPTGTRAGDLDGDGDLDVVMALDHHPTGPLTADSRVVVFLNDGAAHLTRTGDFPAGSNPSALQLEDFDGDGALDYAALGHASTGVTVVHGHGDGTFDATAASYAAGAYPSGLAAGDFDRDGDIDLAAGSKYSVRVLLNQGGMFTGGSSQFFGYYAKALAATDFDADGVVDLVGTFASNGKIDFLHSNGDGTFSVFRSYSAGSMAYALTLGDWNGDGFSDAASADNGSAELITWTSSCGTWTYCTPKKNSLGCLSQLAFVGVPSATSGGGFVISASNLRNLTNGQLFYGTQGRIVVPFHGGTLCVKAPLRRTPLQNSGGNSSGSDCSGVMSFDFNMWIANGVDPALSPGVRVDAQFYSRDSGFVPPNNVGLTNAIEFSIGP